MNFPVWELELGGGLLIAVVAILHVYVSHFAIGGGLFLVVMEHFAYAKDDEALLGYLRRHSRFFILVTLVFGSLTGVGIWFAIGLVSPQATSALIHIFVWAWAIEWVFFFVEITAALVYYQTWDRISRSAHLAVGWVYFVAAYFSLVVINGIITFMLTPGRWLETRSFWDGFFNPTYWPSLVTRTALCVALAGVYALVTASFFGGAPEDRKRLVRTAGAWALVGTLLSVPAMWWYHAHLPGVGEKLFSGAQPVLATAGAVLGWVGPALIVAFLIPVAFPRVLGRPAAIALGLAGLVAFGASEWVREAARKPYVIYGYMYPTGLRPEESKTLPETGGLLANALWVENRAGAADVAAGREVFRVACRACHSLSGYKGMRRPLAGLDEHFLFELAGRLEVLKGKMPAFAGTETERRALAVYLAHEAGEKTLSNGREVFEKRCGFCHTKEGFQPLYEALEGYTREDILDLLPIIGDMTDDMAPWSGTEEQAALLAEYLLSWYPPAAAETGGR